MTSSLVVLSKLVVNASELELSTKLVDWVLVELELWITVRAKVDVPVLLDPPFALWGTAVTHPDVAKDRTQTIDSFDQKRMSLETPDPVESTTDVNMGSADFARLA